MADPYCYPGTEILRNRAGYYTAQELKIFEADATGIRIALLLERSLQGRFDQKHLQAIHHFIFQDVYDWAGELRTVDIAKGGHLFALPQFIQASLTAFFTNLKNEAHLQHLAQNLFIGRSAHYFGELNAIHPFREGNGRSQREFFRELALHAGYVIEWQRLTQEAMIDASRENFLTARPEPFRELLQNIVRPATEREKSVKPQSQILTRL